MGFVAGAAGLALMITPTASADPDPHIPNADAGWCPGGQGSEGGGIKYCNGAPYPSGAFNSQAGSFGANGPFGPWSWRPGAACKVWYNGSLQGGTPSGQADCGGGPSTITTPTGG
jgi:hypothetical protein